MARCKAHNTYMGIYIQDAAEYHRGRQFFLYNMHLALHIRYVTRCSRVSQGHAILFIHAGYMAWCTMHVAGYHRGMQGNFLAVMGQEMSHAPTPKQPICNVFMDLQYIWHILTRSKGDSYFFRQHICTEAQGNLHKTYCGKAQHKLQLQHNINVCTVWLIIM